MSALAVNLPTLHREVLDNGLVVLVAERRTLPLVTLRLTLRAGGAQEPAGSPGLATLAARMLRRGAGPRDAAAFAEELDFLGGLLGSGTGLDHSALDAEFTSATFEQGFELFLDALTRPRFEADEFNAEAGRMIEEIRQSLDDAEEVAEEAFLHGLFGDHPFGRCAVGSTRGIARLRVEDASSFHARRWAPRGGVLAVVGDVDAEAFLRTARERLGGWAKELEPAAPPPRPKPVKGRPVLLVDSPGSRQVQVRLGQVGVARSTPHWFALQVANTVLGGGFTSRLVDRIRVDEGLTYSIGSRFYPGRVEGPFLISTFTENEELERLHGLATGILADFRAHGPTADEVAAAQAYLAGLQPRRIETPGGLALALSEAVLNGLPLDSIRHYRREIEAVSRESASEAARECLPGEDLLTVLVGDAESLQEEAARLGELRVVPLDFGEAVADAARPTGA